MTPTPARVSGLIWHDRNGNGLREATDALWPDSIFVRLERLSLTDSVWAGEQFLQTGLDGLYSFDGLVPGETYRVVINQPGLVSGPVVAGGNRFALGSNPDDLVSASWVPAAGELRAGWNGGVFLPPQVSGQVWQDADADGQRDAGETPVVGAIARLIDAGGRAVETQTDVDGMYYFSPSVPGTYQVGFVAPSGTRFTAANQGSDASDSDANTTTGLTPKFTLVPDQVLGQVDAGLLGQITDLARLGGRLWHDLNNNGLEDAGEPGFSGLRVDLLAVNGSLQARTTTDGDGRYTFDVLPGTYQLLTFGPQGNWQPAPALQGNDRTVDSDLGADGIIAPVTLAVGARQEHIDVGLVRPIRVGDRVWNDLDRDGRQDANEPGVAGVQVKLLDSQGQVLGTKVTDQQGNYAFEGLLPGRYELALVRPVDKAWTVRGESVVDPGTGRTGLHSLLSGSDVLIADAGLIDLRTEELARIGDRVFEDRNGNGIQDTEDVGLVGAEVRLLDSQGNTVAQTRTDVNGQWGLSVAPGSYQIQVVTGTRVNASPARQGNDPARDSDVDARGLSAPFTVRAGQTELGIDAGGWRPATVSGWVFNDRNRDGLQDSGDTGLAGALIRLLDAQGVLVDSQYSDAKGFYSFAPAATSYPIGPGTYTLQASGSAGWVATLSNVGSNESRDSDIDAAGRFGPFKLSSGQTLDVDMGAYNTLATSVSLQRADETEDAPQLAGVVAWDDPLGMGAA